MAFANDRDESRKTTESVQFDSGRAPILPDEARRVIPFMCAAGLLIASVTAVAPLRRDEEILRWPTVAAIVLGCALLIVMGRIRRHLILRLSPLGITFGLANSMWGRKEHRWTGIKRTDVINTPAHFIILLRRRWLPLQIDSRLLPDAQEVLAALRLFSEQRRIPVSVYSASGGLQAWGVVLVFVAMFLMMVFIPQLLFTIWLDTRVTMYSWQAAGLALNASLEMSVVNLIAGPWVLIGGMSVSMFLGIAGVGASNSCLFLLPPTHSWRSRFVATLPVSVLGALMVAVTSMTAGTFSHIDRQIWDAVVDPSSTPIGFSFAALIVQGVLICALLIGALATVGALSGVGASRLFVRPVTGDL